MRIGCLQINPRIGHLAQNVAQAEAALAGLAPPWDLLVLPELAFTGYNFRSLQHILPWLEDAEHGPSLTWARAAARRLRTSVIVGFPQLARDGTRFNSAGFVPREEGRQPLIYNKSHLYYTDERWAAEGRDGFAMLEVEVAGSPKPCKVAMGICMDLNPLAFRAPWDLYELATHALHMDCHVLVIPMAWNADKEVEAEADLSTVQYWASRLHPLIHDPKVRYVVCANRCGVEDDVTYAGSTCVLRVGAGKITAMGMMGAKAVGPLMVEIPNPIN